MLLISSDRNRTQTWLHQKMKIYWHRRLESILGWADLRERRGNSVWKFFLIFAHLCLASFCQEALSPWRGIWILTAPDSFASSLETAKELVSSCVSIPGKDSNWLFLNHVPIL